MMTRKEIVKNLLIIFCVFIILIIPWASVIGIQDPGLLEAAGIFQHSAGFVLITAMVLHLVYQTYGKSLAQELKEEEIKESEQKAEKPLLFKPTIGFLILLLIFITIPVLGLIILFRDHNLDIGFIIVHIGIIGLFVWIWCTVTVFIFTTDSVHIKSHLFYYLGIDRKTVIHYADITSVSPDARIKGDFYGVDRRYRIVISTIEATQSYSLWGYNSEIIAKIYLRFKEKLGDKVTIS